MLHDAMYLIFSIVFNPILWVSPCVITLILACWKMFTKGIYSKFDYGLAKVSVGNIARVYSSANVAFFSIIWIVALTVFSYIQLDNFTSVFLSLCTLFTAYGINEIYSRIIWFGQRVGVFGLTSVLKGAMYPLFFTLNCVPLYLLLKPYAFNEHCFAIFLGFQTLNLLVYIVHGYEARIIHKYETVIKPYYYTGRLFTTISYIILLMGYVWL